MKRWSERIPLAALNSVAAWSAFGYRRAVLSSELWSSFLAIRGVDLETSEVQRLVGGEVNDNFKIMDRDGRAWVVRHYRSTLNAAEIDCELAAVAYLAHLGYGTPAVVPAQPGGRLWETVEARPAALFTFAEGRHPEQRPGGYGSMDLDLGQQAARLAGRLAIALSGHELPGRRSPTREAQHKINAFLSGDLVEHPLFAELVTPLRQIADRIAPLYARRIATGLPSGLIHNDMTPANMLLDSRGRLDVLLDFDDCVQTFLIYELGPIVNCFGKDEDRHVDLRRIAELVAAYDSVRRLTEREREVLPDVLAAHSAAEGISVLSNWVFRGQSVASPLESYSAQTFLELSARRRELEAELTRVL